MITLRRLIPDRWRRLDVTVRDLPFGLLLFALTFTPPFNGHGTQVGELTNHPVDGLAYVVAAVEALSLALRRRWPALCLALVGAGFAADQIIGYHLLAGSALPVALFSIGAHLNKHRRLAAIVGSLAYVPLAIALDRQGSTEGVAGFATFYLVMCIPVGVGMWLRQTRAVEHERRAQLAEATKLAERTRIARELHDVVTHHVTAMVVQAESARYLTAAPERLDQTLTAVTDTGRRAISDLRHLLDLLNPDHETPPPPDLHALVEQTRRAGQPVEFTEDGSPPQAAGSAEGVAYRVVQEALTNALKYAHGSPTEVHVRHSDKEISVRVTTERTVRGASPGGSGRGLAGLRDRVDVLGGEFAAEPQKGGGFVVQARIPARSA